MVKWSREGRKEMSFKQFLDRKELFYNCINIKCIETPRWLYFKAIDSDSLRTKTHRFLKLNANSIKCTIRLSTGLVS